MKHPPGYSPGWAYRLSRDTIYLLAWCKKVRDMPVVLSDVLPCSPYSNETLVDAKVAAVCAGSFAASVWMVIDAAASSDEV